jgi:hypothetical protein
MPLASASQKPVLADEKATLRGMVSEEFDGRKVVYLPPETSASLSSTNARSGEILKTRYRPQSAELEVTSKQGTLLVLAQSYYHPWRATVDGQPTTIWRANHAFQAVDVPPGRHTVRFSYVDRLFHWGVLISTGTLIYCLIAWLKGSSRSPGRRRSESLSSSAR